MKKAYNPISDVRNESVEVTRRLYRAISDVVRHLDERRGRAQTCSDLFLPSLEAQRVKLRDYCEKLIFSDPIGYGRKGEELLWRKGYYDVVTTAKRLRKNNTWSPLEVVHMQSHLAAGVGHYYHLVFRLQIEFKLDLRGIIDFPLLVNDNGLMKGKASNRRSPEAGSVEWARLAVHRCLVYLGDLHRYFLDLYPCWNTGLPLRYYLQALNMNADVGMPHNQLGTLSGTQNYSVDAAYHYLRCLMCPQPFEGAEGNLQRIFEKNAKWLENHYSCHLESRNDNTAPAERIHRFISRFLLLIDIWFFDKTSVPNTHQLCHQTLLDLQQCLTYVKPFPADTDLKEDQLDLEHISLLQSDEGNSEKPEYLKDELVFKMVVMLLLCVSKLQTNSSQQISGVVAFTLAVFSQLVQQVIHHVQDSVFNLSLHSLTPPTSASDANVSAVSSGCYSNLSLVSSPSEPTPEKSTSQNVTIHSQVETPNVESLVNGSVKISNENDREGMKRKPKRKNKKNYLEKLRRTRRRRRRATVNSSEDSDYSDGDFPYGTSSSSDDGKSDISDTEKPDVSSSEEEDDDDYSDGTSSSTQVETKKELSLDDITVSNGETYRHNDVLKSKSDLRETGDTEEHLTNGIGHNAAVSTPRLQHNQSLDPADVIELVAEEGLLDVVKVCADWLRGDSDIIKACGRSSRTLLSRVIALLNLINVDAQMLEKQSDCAKFYKLKNIPELFPKVPLPEDVELKGLIILKSVHQTMDWEFLRHHCLHSKEEALLRVYKLVSFGNFLASIGDTGVSYNETKRLFSVTTDSASDVKQKEAVSSNVGEGIQIAGASRRGELMHSMGQLWLQAEVRDLESRERRRGASFSPYLAVDSEALTGHIHLIKQLVGARKFIVLVPNVVVSALDEMKREVGRAREAIRWLESQFQRGNRFLRGQRLHERLALPLIKYPKKKDKEAWLFFQVVECCHYFSHQSGGLHEVQPETALVTLLTGQRGGKEETSRTYSPLGVAKSAGINLEHIETFHAKWKTSSKSHG